MTEMRRAKRFDDATLAVIEAQYRACEETLEAIGRKHRVTGACICKLARQLGWPRRRATRPAKAADATDAAVTTDATTATNPASETTAASSETTAAPIEEKPKPPAKKKKKPPTDVRVLIKRRMCKVINRKLKEMEQGMQLGTLEPAELERNSKLVASMIGGLGKVGGPEEGKEGDAHAAATGGDNDEVERLQREIVERFERIQRRREAEGRSV